jgi:predicted dehydrogenase
MDSVKIAVVGTGFGARTILPCLRLNPIAEVVGLCGGNDHEKTKNIASKFSIPFYTSNFQQLYEFSDFDLIFIASPHQFHYEMVSYFLNKNKHIVCEKPLAIETEEIYKIIKKSIDDNHLHLINHQLRFHPPIRKIRELILNGELGEPYHLVMIYHTNRYVDPKIKLRQWWFDKNRGGGMLLAMAPHLIDLIQFWFGNTIHNIHTDMDSVFKYSPVDQIAGKKLEAESMFSCTIKLTSGISSLLTCTSIAYQYSFFEVKIYGTKAQLVFKAPNELRLYTSRNDTFKVFNYFKDGDYETINNVPMFHSAFSAFSKALLESISTGNIRSIEDATNFEDYLYKHKVILAMQESKRKGRLIEIE